MQTANVYSACLTPLLPCLRRMRPIGSARSACIAFSQAFSANHGVHLSMMYETDRGWWFSIAFGKRSVSGIR